MKPIMETNLATFATWLRRDMSLPANIEIVIDRAATPVNRKQKLPTRWDHLAKQQSFTMPKVPSRRRLGDTVEEDTTTERPPLSERMIKQTSFSLPRGGSVRRLGGDDDEVATRPGMGVKQSSLSSLPRSYERQTSFNKLTKREQMKMPRLVKQCAFKSLPRGLCDDNQSIGSRPIMKKESTFSLPKCPSRPRRLNASSGGPEPNHQPKLPARKCSSDETTDTLSSMPRLVKQTSFTVAKLSSQGPLIGDDEKGGNRTDRRREMVKQDSLRMPRRPTRTPDSDDENDEKTDTLSSMPQLVEQTSFTVAKLSSQGALIGDDEKGGNRTDRQQQMVKQGSFTMPRRPTRTFDSEDEKNEKADTLSRMPRLVKQPSFKATKVQRQCSEEARLLFIYSTLTEALEVSDDAMDDVCEERDSLAMPMRQTRSI
jgi:hypothetical protein